MQVICLGHVHASKFIKKQCMHALSSLLIRVGLTLPSLLVRYVHRGKTACTSASADPYASLGMPASKCIQPEAAGVNAMQSHLIYRLGVHLRWYSAPARRLQPEHQASTRSWLASKVRSVCSHRRSEAGQEVLESPGFDQPEPQPTFAKLAYPLSCRSQLCAGGLGVSA